MVVNVRFLFSEDIGEKYDPNVRLRYSNHKVSL